MRKILLSVWVSLYGIASAQSISTLTFATPPPPPANPTSVSVQGMPGHTLYTYYIVTQYPAGPVVSTGISLYTAPDTLNGGNYLTISWQGQPGALTYDILRFQGADTPMRQSCTCAVITGIAAPTTTYNDIGAGLSGYVVGAVIPTANGTIQLNNKDYASPTFVSTPSQPSSMIWPGGGAGLAFYGGANSWGASKAAPSGTIVGTTDTQALTNKTVDGVTPTVFSYVDLTSSGQAQLNGKQALAAGLTALSTLSGSFPCYAKLTALATWGCDTPPAGTPGGTNTAVQFNNSGAFGGDATNFSYNSTAHSLNITGGITMGTSPPAVTFGTGNGFMQTEGTAPTVGFPAASVDGCYADSTSHAYKCSFNNSALFHLITDADTGTVTNTMLAGSVALTKLATQAADTVVINASGSTAAPTAVAMPTCTTGASLYNTSTHAWSCVSTGSVISTSGPVADPGGNAAFQYNNAAGVLTFDAPVGTASPVLRRCYRNATGKAGAITIQMATSNTVDLNGADGSSAGTLVSGGALGDSVCLVSDATNHWYAYVGSGSWTNN